MKKFKLDFTFILILILVILSPKQAILIKLIITLIVHEIGHLIICYIFNINVNKITLYASGFIMDINNDDLLFIQSLLLYSNGVIFNILLFLTNIDFELCHISLFLAIINLLPIYPLDGHQILKSVLEYYIPVYQVYIISTILSFTLLCIFLVTGILYKIDMYLLINFIYLGSMTYNLYKNRILYYHSFLLHRYLCPKLRKNKIKNVEKNHINHLFRYHNLIFISKNKIFSEKDVLKHYFKN